MPCLSGTPAEAGVRVDFDFNAIAENIVSVEPPPKQGCELEGVKHSPPQVYVSVEPPPKQGCEWTVVGAIVFTQVSVEPPPKQGCEVSGSCDMEQQ